MRSTLAVLVSAAVAAVAAVAAAPASAAPSAAVCERTGDTAHVVAVFGYRANAAQARALAVEVGKAFQFVSVRRVDCGLWQVLVDGLDTSLQQREFAAEARHVGWEVSYDTLHGPPPPSAPGQVRAIFGSYASVAAADARLARIAAVGFRIANVFRRGNRFTVEVLHVPLAKTEAFARQAHAAKLTVAFEP